MAELRLLLMFGVIFKFQPNLELVVIGHDMPTRFKFVGLALQNQPKKVRGPKLETRVHLLKYM